MATSDRITGPQRWVVHSEVWITRRKRFHVVTDPQGAVRWKARYMGQIIEFLQAEAVECYEHRVRHDKNLSMPRLIVTIERY